jgi:GNAT superfamily N-acetyltransferase
MRAPQELEIRPAGDRDPDVVALRAALDAEVAELYSDVPSFATPAPHDAPQPDDSMLLAVDASSAIGVAGLRVLERDIAELKHLYVVPGARRRGIASRLVGAIEVQAREAGCGRLRLDTGARQREAIALYSARGFREIPAYNASVNVDVWMEKRISPQT